MNRLSPDPIIHIFSFLPIKNKVSSTIINKKVHTAISKTKEYVIEYAKMKWREQQNQIIYNMYKDNMYIKLRKGLMSEAICLMIYWNGVVNDLARKIYIHIKHFPNIEKEILSVREDDEHEIIEELGSDIEDTVDNQEIIQGILNHKLDFTLMAVPLYRWYFRTLDLEDDTVDGANVKIMTQQIREQSWVIRFYKDIIDYESIYSRIIVCYGYKGFHKFMLKDVDSVCECVNVSPDHLDYQILPEDLK